MRGGVVVFWLMFIVQLAALLFGVRLLYKIHIYQVKVNQAFLDYFERVKKNENRICALEQQTNAGNSGVS